MKALKQFLAIFLSITVLNYVFFYTNNIECISPLHCEPIALLLFWFAECYAIALALYFHIHHKP